MWEWIRHWKDELTVAAAIAANVITLAALIFTIYNSNTQLDVTLRLARNSSIYEMQKDQRAAAKEYRDGKEGTLPIFLTMNSIFIQYSLKNIPEEVWTIFRADFCQTMSSARFRNDWQLNMPDKGPFLPAFVKYMDKIVALPQANSAACMEIRS